MFMSEAQEIALGKQSDPSIVAMYGLFENDELQKFINEKGMEMAKISHRPNLPYEFKILDSPVVNAFAVPGGFIYFTRGILAHFNNEAEFAGVLGHEIGHVTARHSAKQQTKATIAQILFIGGLVVSPAFRNFANEAQQGMQLLFLKYSRDNESQSDELGVEYSTQIGYDAHHMANFFNTLNQMRVGTESETLPTFLSTHPDPYDRFKRVGQLADKAQKNIDASTLEVNRDRYLRMIDGMIYGEDPKQGYVENNRFYHPDLRFQFPIPTGWKTVNTPSQVQMAPADGSALMMLTLTDAKSPTAAADSTLRQYNLQMIERKNQNLNGMPVVAQVADQTNEQTGQKIRILSYFISYKNLIFTFHGLSELANFDGNVQFFNQTMRNFTVLNDQAKINKKPNRIVIKTAARDESLENLLKGLRISDADLNEHAVINGIALDQVVKRGSLFKIITK
ncbi:MAG: M48 family metalloprotease [Saprospiraceae bacterium]|nr:M48 family metalloprotease [Saprospiraceae bacterium]